MRCLLLLALLVTACYANVRYDANVRNDAPTRKERLGSQQDDTRRPPQDAAAPQRPPLASGFPLEQPLTRAEQPEPLRLKDDGKHVEEDHSVPQHRINKLVTKIRELLRKIPDNGKVDAEKTTRPRQHYSSSQQHGFRLRRHFQRRPRPTSQEDVARPADTVAPSVAASRTPLTPEIVARLVHGGEPTREVQNKMQENGKLDAEMPKTTRPRGHLGKHAQQHDFRQRRHFQRRPLPSSSSSSSSSSEEDLAEADEWQPSVADAAVPALAPTMDMVARILLQGGRSAERTQLGGRPRPHSRPLPDDEEGLSKSVESDLSKPKVATLAKIVARIVREGSRTRPTTSEEDLSNSLESDSSAPEVKPLSQEMVSQEMVSQILAADRSREQRPKQGDRPRPDFRHSRPKSNEEDLSRSDSVSPPIQDIIARILLKGDEAREQQHMEEVKRPRRHHLSPNSLEESLWTPLESDSSAPVVSPLTLQDEQTGDQRMMEGERTGDQRMKQGDRPRHHFHRQPLPTSSEERSTETTESELPAPPAENSLIPDVIARILQTGGAASRQTNQGERRPGGTTFSRRSHPTYSEENDESSESDEPSESDESNEITLSNELPSL